LLVRRPAEYAFGVQSGLLLLVDADRRVQRGVTRVASELGLEVVACDSARAGLNAACALEPAVIVTELELPDFDGLWFVSQIRQQPTEVAATPIVVATHEIDSSSRGGTLKAGADVFLQKPIAATDLVAHARALMAMAHRVRDRRPAAAGEGAPAVPGVPGIPGVPAVPGVPGVPVVAAAPVVPIAPVAMAAPHLLPPTGGLDRFPAVTVLVALELERRSGRLSLWPPEPTAAPRPLGGGLTGAPTGSAAPLEIELASGTILGGHVLGRSMDPLAAVRAALALSEGRFEFVGGPEKPAPPMGEFTGRLIAMVATEAPRSRHGAGTAPPSSEPVTEKLPPRAAPTRHGTRPPPVKATPTRPPARPSKPPRGAAKPVAVKVPPPVKVPAFGTAAGRPAPAAARPPAPKPPAAGVAAPPRPAIPPGPPRPVAARAASGSGPDTRRRGTERTPPAPPAAARTAPPGAPDVDDEDIIEAENDT
jgi:CheY-like chemotaxis protein